MDWECRKCGADNVSAFPFGDNVFCSNCGAEHTTDWDYVNDDDDMAAWVVALVAPTPKE